MEIWRDIRLFLRYSLNVFITTNLVTPMSGKYALNINKNYQNIIHSVHFIITDDTQNKRHKKIFEIVKFLQTFPCIYTYNSIKEKLNHI